jgi:hypothetical protein
MEEEFVPHEEALALKKLGFDEPCFAYYDMAQEFNFPGCTMHNRNFINVKATMTPLYQQAFRWFREKYGMLVSVEFVEPEYGGDYGYKLYYKPGYLYIDHWSKGFKTYEEAELACLRKLIELVKKNKL